MLLAIIVILTEIPIYNMHVSGSHQTRDQGEQMT